MISGEEALVSSASQESVHLLPGANEGRAAQQDPLIPLVSCQDLWDEFLLSRCPHIASTLAPRIAVPFQTKDPMETTCMLYHPGRASREHQADPINPERTKSKDPPHAAVGLGDGDHIKSRLGQGKPKAFSYCWLIFYSF